MFYGLRQQGEYMLQAPPSSRAIGLLLLCLVGCGQRDPEGSSQVSLEKTPSETAPATVDTSTSIPSAGAPTPHSSFAQQLAEVQAGRTNAIQITDGPVTPSELESLPLADGLLRDLLLDSGVDFEGLTAISRLKRLEHLRIRESPIDDEGLATLCAGQPQELIILNLPQAQVTAMGIAELAKLPKLSQLRLGGKQIDDAAAAAIAELKNLRSLHLIGPSLTDAGLDSLAASPRLSSFYLDDCPLGDAAWQRLFDAKPGLHVHIDQQHHDRDPHAHQH